MVITATMSVMFDNNEYVNGHDDDCIPAHPWPAHEEQHQPCAHDVPAAPLQSSSPTKQPLAHRHLHSRAYQYQKSHARQTTVSVKAVCATYRAWQQSDLHVLASTAKGCNGHVCCSSFDINTAYCTAQIRIHESLLCSKHTVASAECVVRNIRAERIVRASETRLHDCQSTASCREVTKQYFKQDTQQI